MLCFLFFLVEFKESFFGSGFMAMHKRCFRYSGDWSRIGVITPQTEDLLKLAAFLVVPLCIFLIFFLPSEQNS